ncbi:MAG: N-acetyl-gamma-glutamyl-phosphate reductase [Firmicutes bacterium]|nr:N-acetyl-gamma-glutamyl-phosphate reductase [Bacillota bacterium]
MTKVFIDGSSGTTGLRIYERLAERKDLELITLSDELRKDPRAKKAAFAEADIAFLCLPDAAAMEAAELAAPDTVIIDTSTAHRTADGWIYGMPELAGHREKIAASKRIANPGCHASGFIALAAPLVKAGLIAPDTALTCFSVTGYSGGGKSMIADYESDARIDLAEEGAVDPLDSPKQYGLTQSHKHLKEMQKISGLNIAPVFCPIVADFYSGMTVTVPLFAKDLKGTVKDIEELYKSVYSSKLLHYETCPDGGVFGNALAGRDDMTVTIAGNEERILLISCFDNLGKGASGAAIQNMNIVLGLPEETGLTV